MRKIEHLPVVAAQTLSPEHLHKSPEIETVLKTDSLVLLTGKAHPKLAHAVGEHLSMILEEPIVVYEATSRFPDGSINTSIEPNLRNRHVFFIQGAPGVQRVIEGDNGQEITMSVNDAEAEVYHGIDAARRASAVGITVVTPYHFNSRSDKKDRPRISIAGAATAQSYEDKGVSRIVTVDLHAEQEQGYVKIPWDNLEAAHVLIPAIKDLGIENLVVAAPDAGGVKRAEKYRNQLKAENIAVIFKDRDKYTGDIRSLGQVNGDVQGKPVLVVDDIIGSGSTAKQALELLKANGATDVYLAVTHGIFSEESLKNLSGFARVFFTDSFNHDGLEFPPNMTEISIAPLLAEVIKRIHTGESLSKGLFLNGKNGHNHMQTVN